MDKAIRIGVVTVTYNSASVLSDFMASILKQDYRNIVIYIIDNASTDNTLGMLSEYCDPRVVIISNRANVGVAEGNNIGIRAALKDGCAAVLLINNDTLFEGDLVAGLIEGLDQYDCDMIVPKILHFDQRNKIWCAGGYFSRIRASARHFGNGSLDNGSFDRAKQVTYSPTCCMLIKIPVFERIGLMDANYFVYFDDTDFCYRAYRAGLKLYYLPSVSLLHKVSSLTGGESDFYYWYTIRNHVYYILKHSPGWQLPFYFFAYQIHILIKFMFVIGKPRIYVLAQRAFWQGLALFNSRRGTDYSAVTASAIGNDQ